MQVDRERSRSDAPQSPFEAVIQGRDADIEHLVRRALAEGQARLAFQPIVLTDEPKRVSFYETLIRLLDTGGRVLPAKHFFPLLGDSVLGREMDCCSLRMGLDRLRRSPGLRLAVNMSARSIADGKWRAILMGALDGDDGLGHRLILEISEESAMLLPEVVIRFMEEMQPYGVMFSLDNFGAGHIAFSHLKDFFFDLAKIDSRYIRDIHKNPDNQVLAEALNTVAHQFEMFTVAEGVETAAEAEAVRLLGVDCLQGYYFGRPSTSI